MTEPQDHSKARALALGGCIILSLALAMYLRSLQEEPSFEDREETIRENDSVKVRSSIPMARAELPQENRQEPRADKPSHRENSVTADANETSKGGAACQEDTDCHGPKTADCVRASCRDGRCVTDHSRCGCRTNSDCDDRDPCTRDLCFARTLKCVHMPQKCN